LTIYTKPKIIRIKLLYMLSTMFDNCFQHKFINNYTLV